MRSISSPTRSAEALGAKRGVGHGLGERDRAGDDDRRLSELAAGGQGVEGGDPKADEVRRRRDVRGVARAARGVVADAARRQVGAELASEVSRARRRRERRPRRGLFAQRLGVLGERGDQVGLNRARGVDRALIRAERQPEAPRSRGRRRQAPGWAEATLHEEASAVQLSRCLPLVSSDELPSSSV